MPPKAERIRAAVLGRPIAHSLSPLLHNAAYRELGIPAEEYAAYEVAEADLSAFIDSHPELTGLSMTMPLKYEAVRLGRLHGWDIDGTAELVGGANTLVRGPDGMSLHNTDVSGIVRAFARFRIEAAEQAVLVGSGATAASATAALARMGVSDLTICARNPQSRAELAGLAAKLGMRARERELGGLDLRVPVIVSTLPAGAVEAQTFEWPDGMESTTILDAAYAAEGFSIGAHACRLGARLVAGQAMLVEQAVEQLLLFAAAAGLRRGLDPERIAAAMYTALDAAGR